MENWFTKLLNILRRLRFRSATHVMVTKILRYKTHKIFCWQSLFIIRSFLFAWYCKFGQP